MTIVLDGSRGISIPDGSVTEPSIRGINSNTGIFYTNNDITFTAGGVERFKIAANGTVVVSANLTTTGAPLAVTAGGTGANTANAALAALGGLSLAGGTLTGPLVLPAGTVSAPGLTVTSDTNTGMFFPAADTIAFTEGGVEAMRLDSLGRMALGTTTANARFTLAGDYSEGVVTANTGSTYTIDLTNGTVQNLTLTASCTFTFPAATTAGRSFLMFLRQDATGNRTVTWPGTLKWPAATAPTLTSTASRTDMFAFTADGSSWFGRVIAQNYS